MDKVAQLQKYLPRLALGATGLGALGLGGYQLLKPEPTMFERAQNFVGDIGQAVGPSLSDMASDVSTAFANNPQLLNSFMAQAQPPQQMQPQPPAEAQPYPVQPRDQEAQQRLEALSPEMGMDQQSYDPYAFNSYEGLSDMQNQLQSMTPYSGFAPY